MGESARQAVAIEAGLRRALGDLPAFVDVEAALARLRRLKIEDAADEIVVRDTIAGLSQTRNAAEIAERRRR
jgi:hypothetical protein